MRTYKTVEVTRKETQLVEQKCDICGTVAKYSDSWCGGTYEVDETEIKVTVKRREGESYPSGGSGTEYNIDICPTCFKSKLIPWLRSQGADIKEEDWDF